MASLLVKNIHTLVTMDDARREIRDAWMLIEGPAIQKLGSADEVAPTADEVLDLKSRHLVLPGLINTHHHFYQVLTRAVPAAQDCELFGWLQTLYPIWAKLTSEAIYVSAQMAAAELMLSGCTTSSDHLYLFPNDCTLDDEIRGVREMGLRFHASRGSMSVGVSQGGLPPDSLVENEAAILKDSQRLIETYHDNQRHSMTRMTLAPCSPFSVSTGLMKDSAALARSYAGVRLHTHLAENELDVSYSLEKFGSTPGEYAESLSWTGRDVCNRERSQHGHDRNSRTFTAPRRWRASSENRRRSAIAYFYLTVVKFGVRLMPMGREIVSRPGRRPHIHPAPKIFIGTIFSQDRAANPLPELLGQSATALWLSLSIRTAECRARAATQFFWPAPVVSIGSPRFWNRAAT